MTFDWRKAVGKAVSFAAIIAITAALAEAIFALMLRFPEYLPDQTMPALREYYYAEDQRFIQYLPSCAKYDAELTYALKPGSCRFSGREFDTVVTINSLGVRDDEESLRAPEIFVLGDSIAMGWGVADNETFASVIEKETGIKTLNLAVSSYGTVREFGIAMRADASRLNTIVVQYFFNDLRENKTYFDNGNRLPISDESTYEAARREHLRQTGYFVGKHVWWMIRQLAASLIGSAHAQEEREEARYFFNVLYSKLAELTQRANLAPNSTLVIVEGLLWPVETSREVMADLGPRPASISHILEIGYQQVRAARFPLDGHLTAVGHRELAKQIIRIVRDKCYLANAADGPEGEQQQGECEFFLDEL